MATREATPIYQLITMKSQNIMNMIAVRKNKATYAFFTWFLNHTPIFRSVYGTVCLHRVQILHLGEKSRVTNKIECAFQSTSQFLKKYYQGLL